MSTPDISVTYLIPSTSVGGSSALTLCLPYIVSPSGYVPVCFPHPTLRACGVVGNEFVHTLKKQLPDTAPADILGRCLSRGRKPGSASWPPSGAW